jgi:hypothetical protein
MITVLWIRYTVMTAETLNFIDSVLDAQDPAGHPAADMTISQKVDDFCTGLEALVVEFEMERHMKAPNTPDPIRCLFADHLMNIYAVIIGMKRLTNPPDAAAPVDPTTLRAARKVVSTLLDFETDPALPGPEEVFIQYVTSHTPSPPPSFSSPSPFTNPPTPRSFISFYPFCAVFSLYTHILTSPDPAACDADLRALEAIAAAMTRTCSVRPNFVPFANTIAALNRVSRAIQDERLRLRCQQNQVTTTTTTAEATTGTADREGGGGGGSGRDPSDAAMLDALPAAFDMAAFQELASRPLGSGQLAATTAAAAAEGEMDPLGFVRALENDFIARNWHEDWWEMDGAGLGGGG